MNEETKARLKQRGIYSWVPWFRSLANKIAGNGEEFLVQMAHSVNWGVANPTLLRYGEEGIDPFSFFYFLASRNGTNSFQAVCASVHKTFELPDDWQNYCPTERKIIPTPIAFHTLFHDGENFHRNLLWSLFRQAANENPEISANTFEHVLKIRGVGIYNLTQCLFLINPREFLPIDEGVIKICLPEHRRVTDQIRRNGYSRFVELYNRVREQFPGCDSFEINQFVYELNSGNIVNSNSKFYAVNTKIYTDGTDYWDNFSNLSCVTANQSADSIFEPRRGDVLLTKFGTDEGRGVGVVLENEYKEKGVYSDQSVIRVNWINKSSTSLPSPESESDFCEIQNNSPIYSAFAGSAEYASTMELVSKHVEENGKTPPQPHDIPKLNTILYGPPGTGKTYKTAEHCVRICNGSSGNIGPEEVRRQYKSLVDEGRVQFVTFHQSYSYEEFVEGLRPKTDGDIGFRLEPEDGILKEIALKARNNSEEFYVLIIDEINRANISKVLGELITLLEEDKRKDQENEVNLRLPYSREEFSLPKNLHILGTMNTADRSIALLDTALRRRFEFEEMMPKPELLDEASKRTGVNLVEVLQSINGRIEFLKDRDHLVGHAWLMNAEKRDDLDQIMRRKIIPLIAEYFHDDWESVQAILGGTNDFVQCISLSPPPGIKHSYEDRYRWSIRDSFPEDAYDGLIGKISE